MLKRLLLLWIFSGSLDSFSQVADGTKPKQDTANPKFQGFWNCWGTNSDSTKRISKFIRSDRAIPTDSMPENIRKWVEAVRHAPPDTLRAICLVSLFQNGIAHARMGFVVIADGKEVEYLDCRKKALKLPQVGWGYRVVNPNERVR